MYEFYKNCVDFSELRICELFHHRGTCAYRKVDNFNAVIVDDEDSTVIIQVVAKEVYHIPQH